MDLAKLRDESIPSIVPALVNLTAEQLGELLALEKADPKPRSGLIEAIELQQTHLADKAAEDAAKAEATAKAAEEAASAKGGAKAKAVAAANDKSNWRHPDYLGPLSGGQALWRAANIKPVRAEGVKTK